MLISLDAAFRYFRFSATPGFKLGASFIGYVVILTDSLMVTFARSRNEVTTFGKF